MRNGSKGLKLPAPHQEDWAVKSVLEARNNIIIKQAWVSL